MLLLRGCLASFSGAANLATLVDTQAAASVNVIYNYLAHDLSLSKTHTGIFTAGTQGVYNLTVTNKESTATSGTITVNDTLPSGLSFVSNSNADWSCVAAGQVLTCTSTTPIAGNGTSSFFIAVNVANSTLSSINNTAQVSGELTDPLPNDNTSTDPTLVNHLPTVSNSTVSPITPGSTIQLPSSSITANPNDISDSIVNYTITSLPDAIVGTIYLGNPSSGGTPITLGQVLSPVDITNIYFISVGSGSATTGFTYTAKDSLGGVSITNGTVNLSIVNNPAKTSPSVITSNPTTTATTPTPAPKSATGGIGVASANPTETNSINLINQINKGSVLGVSEISTTPPNLIRTGGEESSNKCFLLLILAIFMSCLQILSIRKN